MTAHEKDVRSHHALGMTDKQIAEAIGRSRERVGEIRRSLGLSANSARRPACRFIDREYLAREFDESMKALQTHGDHAGVRRQIKRVANEMGASYKRLVHIYTHELKLVHAQATRKYTDEQYAEARRLLDDHGLSYTEVERQTGIPRDRLGKIIPGRGLTPSEAQTVRWVNVHMRKMGI